MHGTITDDNCRTAGSETAAITEALAQRIGAKKYRIWFQNCARFTLTDGYLRIGVANPFLATWLEGHFLKEIKAVKKGRIGFENQESVTGMAGIGAPLMNHTGQVIAAFAVTGNAENIMKQKEKIIEAVQYTSRELSCLLGYRQKT